MNRWLRIGGTIAGLAAGAFFIAYAYRALHGQDLGAMLRPRVALSLCLLTLLYLLLIPITSMAWSLLLRGLGKRVPFAVTAPILATSQFGKYLPGNVAHHVGRLVMARSTGVGIGVGVLSIAYETVLAVLACAHLGALTFLWDTPKAFEGSLISDNRALLTALATAGAVATLAAAPYIAKMVWRFRNKDDATQQPPTFYPGFAALSFGYACNALNFVLVGFGLWVMVVALGGGAEAGVSPVFLIGAFASSWLIGFIVPGAPAGLGVREAVLTVWLSESLPPDSIVVLVLGLRIATTLGDLINLAWGSLALRLRHKRDVAPLVET